jgi:uncharacterized protein
LNPWTPALLTALLLGCNGQPAPRPSAPAAEPAPPPATAGCTADAECTDGWRPSQMGCGPVDRCVEGACAQPPAITGVANAQTARLSFETALGERSFDVEVQDDPFETARGMMCRRSMQPGWGMVFLMTTTRPQSFWMKNTLIPLDILFLDEDWTLVGIVRDAEPRSLSARGVETPSRFVLELAAGGAAKAGLALGDKARFYPPQATR